RLIDTAATGDVSSTLIDELIAGDEDEVALRGSSRYLRRLAPRKDTRKPVASVGRAGTDAFALRVAVPGVLDTLEYHAVPGAVVKRPPTLTPEAAAAIPLVFVTAHYGLNTLAKMKAGDRVLIHNASGGVGLAAIQLAQRAGAEIFATAGSDEKRAMVRGLGV